MLLNVSKTKIINLNFTNKYQFSSRLSMNDKVLETISETKLLGVIVTNTISWDPNTQYIFI